MGEEEDVDVMALDLIRGWRLLKVSFMIKLNKVDSHCEEKRQQDPTKKLQGNRWHGESMKQRMKSLEKLC